MKTLKLVIPGVILTAGFLVCTTASYGTNAIAKKESKSCVYCHTTAGKKDLNDTGKCYGTNKSLEKCPAPPAKK